MGQRDDFPKIVLKETRLLPIRSINFSDPAEKAMHDKMVSLVERMLALHKQSPRSPQEQEMVKREIESTDRGIDRLVYELYGLTRGRDWDRGRLTPSVLSGTSPIQRP